MKPSATRVSPFMTQNYIIFRFVLLALRRRLHGKQQSCWVVCLQLLSGQRAFAVGEVGSDLAPTLLMGFSRVPTTNSGELKSQSKSKHVL